MNLALRIALGVGLLIAAGGGTFALIETRPTAEKKEPEPVVVGVRAVEVERVTEKVRIEATGTVTPARSVVIQPDVGGRIVFQDERFVPGGRFAEGELMVRVDKRDYKLALERERANVVQSDLQLKLERSRKSVAEREWRLVDNRRRPTGEGKELSLREPQVASAQATSEAARSGLERARLNLRRTAVKAPFNGMLLDESSENGQLVSPQSRLGTFVGTDEFWVRVSVPVARLAWFDVPGVNADQGARARVVHEMGDGARVERFGRVVRLLGDLDARGRMAQVIVAVEDPLGLEPVRATQRMPLILGAYVSVTIEGHDIEDVIALPRTGLRDGTEVWVVRPDETLEVRRVEVLWRGRDTVYLKSGLEPGERVVMSHITDLIPGIRLRVEIGGEKETIDGGGPAGGAR